MAKFKSFGPYVLVCIDVQPAFAAAQREHLIQNCRREIGQAMSRNCHILFVEYYNGGETDIRLKRLVGKYHRVHSVIKTHDDGGFEVVETLRSRNLKPTTLRVIGVNTDACVAMTVWSLEALLPKTIIQVVPDACDSEYSHADGLEYMRSCPAVQFIQAS